MSNDINPTVNKAKWRTKALQAVILSALTFLAMNFMTTVSLNVFIPAVSEMKDIPVTVLFNANTIGNLVSVALLVVLGLITNKVSLKTLTIIGLFLGGFSYMMIPLSPAALTPVFIGLNFNASILYTALTMPARIGNWFPKRKGEILGMATAVIILSSLVILPLFNKGVGTIGITKTMIIVGCVLIGYGVVCIFFLHDYPQQVGLLPENGNIDSSAIVTDVKKDNYWTYGKLLKNVRFWGFSLGWGLVMPGLIGLGTAVMPIMTSRGVEQGTAVAVAAFAGVFQLVGSIASGFIDTRFSQRFVVSLFVGIEAFGLALFAFAPDGAIVLMIIGYYMVMFMMGGPNNLEPSTTITLAEGKSIATVLALHTAIVSIIRSFASSILAFSLDNYGSYTVGIIIFMVGAIAGVILLNIFGFRGMEKKAKAAE